jgi:hypothetical protein
MADTIQNIKLTANTWIDLYAATGITVGVQITVENLASTPVKLHTSAGLPTPTDAKSDETGAFSLLQGFSTSVNAVGDSGAWACSDSDGLLNTRIF